MKCNLVGVLFVSKFKFSGIRHPRRQVEKDQASPEGCRESVVTRAIGRFRKSSRSPTGSCGGYVFGDENNGVDAPGQTIFYLKLALILQHSSWHRKPGTLLEKLHCQCKHVTRRLPSSPFTYIRLNSGKSNVDGTRGQHQQAQLGFI